MDRASRAFTEWQKERPDLDGSVMRLLGRLAEAWQSVSDDHLNPLFLEYGLRYGEFDVLATLRRAGKPYSVSPTDLYAATMVTSGAMTGRVDRLEKAGLVKRKKDPDDRRGVRVTLTGKGYELIDDLVSRHVENESRILSGLTRQEQDELSKLLGKLIVSLPEPWKDRG